MHDPTFPSFRVGRRWLVSVQALEAWVARKGEANEQ
ncbi:MAG: helix-turn-helix domain-containing protein [Clostridiales bacterium]|nr:helix-turn-helix domain-containing protein [Clostridiales bacterium]